MQRRGDQDEAVHKQPRADDKRQGQPRTGSSGAKQEGAAQAERPQKTEEGDTTPSGLEHPGRNKQQGPPPPQTGASEDKWPPNAPHSIVRGGPSSRHRRPPDWSIQGPAAVDAPRTGTSGAEQATGATGSHSSGHEDKMKAMQQSREEDEAGEKRRRQDEVRAKVTQ